MFPFSALWFDTGYIFMSVYRGLVHGSDCRKLRSLRICSSSMVVDFLVVVHRPIPMVLLFSGAVVFPQLQFLYEVIDVPGMQVVQVRRCVQRQVPSTAAVHQQGRPLPFRGAEAISHGLTVPADH